VGVKPLFIVFQYFWRRLILDTARVLFKNFSGKSPIIILLSLLLAAVVLLGSGPLQAADADKERIARQVAQKWIQIGTEQYNRGYFNASEQSLLRARDYREYLTESQREQLNVLLEKAHKAAKGRKRIQGYVQAAGELADSGQTQKPKITTAKAKDGGTEARKEKAPAEAVKQIETLPALTWAKQPGRLQQRQLVAAQAQNRPNSSPQTVEERLLTDEAQADDSGQWQVSVKRGRTALSGAEASGPDTGSYIDVVKRKRNILRGHTKAVVDDAVSKAQTYISQKQYVKATEAVEAADRVVNENYLQLGDYFFNLYSSQLKQLKEAIDRGQAEQKQLQAKTRYYEATMAQAEFRKRMETERQNRINELLKNALVYQKKQKYDEALGQLKSLLAIDPQHNEALILKQTLEDMKGFREQLQVRKESDKERAEILLRTDESSIPYADEIKHPRTWREIVAKPTRQPEEAIGHDPASVATYRQLEEIVDLSGLMPEMSLGEAVDELKNSVTPPLKIVVLWRDLFDNAEIDQTTPINMSGISAVPLGTALELLLKSVSGGLAELGYIVENGVITIATMDSLPTKLETLVYDVTHLIGRPADFYATTGGGGVGGGGAYGGGGGGGGRGGGGGGGGYGGGGGGGAGGGTYFAEYFDTEEEEIDREQMRTEMEERKQALIDLIVNTIEPDSWFETGTGEGTITFYQNKKLVVRQTREIHNKLQKLLKEMRKALGHQVAIEARFLVVGENFLEDIGIDMDFWYNRGEGKGLWEFKQNSSDSTIPLSTGVTGSLGSSDRLNPVIHGINISGGYHKYLLDELSAKFIIRAAQAHKDSKSLTAPKVTVLSGESATMRVQRTIRYALPPDVSYGGYGGGYGGAGDVLGGTGYGGYGGGMSGMTQNYGEIPTGTVLNITPTVTPDKKHVLLNIVAELRDFLGFETTTVEFPTGAGGEISEYEVKLPQTEISRVRTRVSVPDSGTLLLGGQKITEEVEREAGVPILSKVPILGRLFSNRSKIKDQKILLILVKPTIILQEEVDAEAIAALEKDF